MSDLCCAACFEEQSLKTNGEILYCYKILCPQCKESALVYCSGLAERTLVFPVDSGV